MLILAIINFLATTPDLQQTLNTTAVVGSAIALLVAITLVCTCGVLAGLLVRRRRRRSTFSATYDLPSPIYEEISLTPGKTILLEENTAYGHIIKN